MHTFHKTLAVETVGIIGLYTAFSREAEQFE